VLQKYFQNTDYLGTKTVANFPALRGVVTREHQVDFEPSIVRVQSSVGEGCGSGSAGTVFYQWGTSPTPPAEQADPLGSIRSAVAAIRGLALDPSLFGFQPGTCLYNLEAGVTIDALDIQGEALLSEGCVAQAGVKSYINLATAVAGYARARNPRIVIEAQVSFRFTPPSIMIDAVHRLSAIVDGFLLSYPLNPALDTSTVRRKI
jgi:hypothetical protein